VAAQIREGNRDGGIRLIADMRKALDA